MLKTFTILFVTIIILTGGTISFFSFYHNYYLPHKYSSYLQYGACSPNSEVIKNSETKMFEPTAVSPTEMEFQKEERQIGHWNYNCYENGKNFSPLFVYIEKINCKILVCNNRIYFSHRINSVTGPSANDIQGPYFLPEKNKSKTLFSSFETIKNWLKKVFEQKKKTHKFILPDTLNSLS